MRMIDWEKRLLLIAGLLSACAPINTQPIPEIPHPPTPTTAPPTAESPTCPLPPGVTIGTSYFDFSYLRSPRYPLPDFSPDAPPDSRVTVTQIITDSGTYTVFLDPNGEVNVQPDNDALPVVFLTDNNVRTEGMVIWQLFSGDYFAIAWCSDGNHNGYTDMREVVVGPLHLTEPPPPGQQGVDNLIPGSAGWFAYHGIDFSDLGLSPV